ncbi:hypothetical protein CHS0354_025192 [Potamilus streckersoni]|uniref:PDZ domain-containing protein 8 n=1 Tax=Potamilus streckersoni TaxID=2493646 RepID=A0AAE0RMT8_9BIVA|nr:hypothetical protein CHS0354_025192 [Potamilus streckersoni]
MIVTTFVTAFIMGVIVTLLVEYCLIRRKLLQLRKVETSRIKQTEKHKLPEVLLKYVKDHVAMGGIGDEAKKKKEEVETCLFLNCLFQFLFRELKDTKEIRRWVVKKMNVEFEDLLKTTAGKLFDQIQVQEFNLGEAFPVIKSVVVRNVDVQKDAIEVLDLAVDIDYSGGFQMAVKVDMVFGSWAYLSVKITKLKGTARLQLSRQPYTHWSFAFYEEPQMEFDVDSSFNGRPIPQITSLIVNQIRRTIRKKHMLPNYKMRFKPFFIKPVEPRPLKDVYISGHKLGVGTLEVCVVECSRLLEEQPFSESYLYCTVSVDKNRWTEMRKGFWITLDLEIHVVSAQPIGITFREDLTYNSDRKVVIVGTVVEDSPAFIADVRQGDVVAAIQDVKVISTKQAARLIRSSGERFIMRVERSKAIHSSFSKLQEDIVTLKEIDQDNPNEADTATTVPEETEDYVNISHKPDDKITKPADSTLKQVTETAKLSEKSLPKKGLFLLSTGKRMIFGRQKDVLKESENVLEDVKLRSSSPSPIPEVRSRNTRGDDIRIKPRESQSATSSPKKIISSDLDSIELSHSAKSSPQKRSVNGFEKHRTHSDTNLNNKVPEDLQTDNLSLGGEYESSPDNVDAPFVDQRTTSEVKFSKNPVWRESFKFEVSEEENYVNICLWCKVPPKLDKNERAAKPEVRIPIGYVSLPVADIALSCVLTIQGDVQQTLHLIPSDAKAGARRRFPKYAGKSGFEQDLCYGDITLVFQHTPSKISAKDRTFLVSQSDNIARPLSSEVSLNGPSVVSRPQKESLENKHKFVAKQFQSVTFCHFCGKKIWMKGAYQCSVCDMICHKKCVEKCQLQTVCTQDGVKLRARPSERWHIPIRNTEPERQLGDKDDLDRTGGIFSKFRRDASLPKLSVSTVKYQKTEVRGITPTRSPQPSPSPSPLPSPTESPVVGRKKFGPIPNEQQAEAEIRLLLSPNLTNVDEKCDSADEYGSDTENQNLQNYLQIARKRHKPGTPGQSLDDTIVMKAKEKGRELFTDLSLPDRKKKLDDMVTKLQQEIDKESEHKADLLRMEAEATERAHKKALGIQVEKSEEKMEALMMMIVHYCAGLQHCLDQEEEERRKTENSSQNSISFQSQNSTTSVMENSIPVEDQFGYSQQTTADAEDDEFQFDIDT